HQARHAEVPGRRRPEDLRGLIDAHGFRQPEGHDGSDHWACSFQTRKLAMDPSIAAAARALATIAAPTDDSSGLAWADGSLWVGAYRNRKIHQVDPASGAVLRTIDSDRFVTGVTWVDGELWHGTW